ncbi:MAG TPA: hypothetical protein VK928_03570 [Longimicrobiales bacterium]|nr:hypothetical protein [Longimicrobiales bacterium]
MSKQKKPYAPPTITTHGDVVKETKGLGGRFWELLNPIFEGMEDGPIKPE